MDMNRKDEFASLWHRYFDGAELPIVRWDMLQEPDEPEVVIFFQ